MSIEMNQIHLDLKELNRKVERLIKVLSMLTDNSGAIVERMRYK